MPSWYRLFLEQQLEKKEVNLHTLDMLIWCFENDLVTVEFAISTLEEIKEMAK